MPSGLRPPRMNTMLKAYPLDHLPLYQYYDALFKNCQHPATRVINLFSRKILVRRSASTSTRGLASVLLVTSASISTPIRMEGQQSSFFTHFYSFKFDEQSPLSSDNTPSSLYFLLSSTHFYPGK